MRKDLLPYYLRNITIRGFEETDAEKAAREAKEAEESEDDDDEDEDDPDKEKSKEGEGEGKDKDTDNLKSALQKERAARKKLERELRSANKFKKETEDKDKSEADKAKDDASSATEKATKLAERLKKSTVDNVLIKLATKMKFVDLDDALSLVDRSLIEVDQDEDDPADIEVDEATVKTALDALKKKKPHLIVAEGQEGKSGSKFGGGRKSQEEGSDEALRAKYSALNRSGHGQTPASQQ